MVLEEEGSEVILRTYIVLVKLGCFFYSVKYLNFHCNPFMDGQGLGFFFQFFDCVNFFAGGFRGILSF